MGFSETKFYEKKKYNTKMCWASQTFKFKCEQETPLATQWMILLGNKKSLAWSVLIWAQSNQNKNSRQLKAMGW